MSKETRKPMEGTWTLTAPDGRSWQDESPLRVCGAEQRERVPDDVALSRILRANQPFVQLTTEEQRVAHDLVWQDAQPVQPAPSLKYELTESNVKDLLEWMRTGNFARTLRALENLQPDADTQDAALAQPVQPAATKE